MAEIPDCEIKFGDNVVVQATYSPATEVEI